MSQPQGEKPQSAPPSPPQQSKNIWEFADLGFDTVKKHWFIQFYDEVNKNLGLYAANDITISKGSAAQYQWKDTQGKNFWHVRERFFAREVEGFTVHPSGSIRIACKGGTNIEAGKVPEEFAYLTYAYHLSNKDENWRAPMGFVEFFNSKGGLLCRIENRWIIIEGVNRKTTGEYPKIRLRIESKDVKNIILTRSAIILQGGQNG